MKSLKYIPVESDGTLRDDVVHFIGKDYVILLEMRFIFEHWYMYFVVIEIYYNGFSLSEIQGDGTDS